MTISSATSSAMTGFQPQMSDEMKQRMQDFRALAKAIQSGDTDAAKQAFATFQKDIQGSSSDSTDSTDGSSSSDPIFGDSNSQASKDLAAVGKALDSGDVDAAKDAFSTLQTDMKAARGGRPHGPPPPPPSGSSDGSSSDLDFQAILDSATGSSSSSSQTNTRGFSAYA